MWVEHHLRGTVPTYGGPDASYTLAERDLEGKILCEQFDHGSGTWLGFSELSLVGSERAHLEVAERALQTIASVECRGSLSAAQEIARHALLAISSPPPVPTQIFQSKGTGQWHVCQLQDRIWRAVNDLWFRSRGQAANWAKGNGYHILDVLTEKHG